MIVVRRDGTRTTERVQQEMEEVFRALMPARRVMGPGRTGLWRPPLEVYEVAAALVVRAEVAGIDPGQLRISINDNVLSIRGERIDAHQDEKRCYHEARIPDGPFGADVFIPFPVDADGAEADYDNGFLRIVLPKVLPRTIVAQSGSHNRGEPKRSIERDN